MFAYRSHLPIIPIWLLVLVVVLVLAGLSWVPGMDSLVAGNEEVYRQMRGGLALRFLSVLSAGVSIWLFDGNLRLVAPGARAQSRVLFTTILLFLAPAFIQSGLAALPGMFALALTLAGLWFAVRAMEEGPMFLGVAAGLFFGSAMVVQPVLWPVLIILQLAVSRQMVRYRRVAWLPGLLLSWGLVLLPLCWLGSGDMIALCEHCLLRQWSVMNFFRSSFFVQARVSAYDWPNGLYVLFPLFYPAFCVVLPGLLLLLKRTDWQAPVRRTLLCAVVGYLLFIGGLPGQSFQYLLPAYVLILLLLFQTWDRFQSYGEFFLPRLAFSIIAAGAVVQLAANVAYGLP